MSAQSGDGKPETARYPIGYRGRLAFLSGTRRRDEGGNHSAASFRSAFEVGADELRRDLRDDGVAVGAQLSHSGGNPSSQPANSGWREPAPFSIGAFEVLAVVDTCDGSGEPPAPKLMFGPPFSPSEARTVDQSANTISRSGRAFRSSVSWLADLDLWSLAVAVGHIAITIASSRLRRPCSHLFVATRGEGIPRLGSPSFAVAVGHKPIAIPEMVRVRARGLQRDCPHGVSHLDQITSHETEPVRRSRNLLSKDDWRASDLDKASEYGPQVALVFSASALAGDGPWLTWTRPGPHGPVIGPSGEAQGERPASDAAEEVAAGVPGQVGRSNIDD